VEITVELRDITKKFGDVTAVDKLSLKVGRGEFFSLLGPSGCGKTTTLRLIAGFEKPTGGRIFLNNENVIHKRPYERNVNTVFQSYALFPHLTVAGNISLGLERKRTPRRQIEELIEEILDLVRL
jgi:spermidine/putrescine transport system ATP-binding protein